VSEAATGHDQLTDDQFSALPEFVSNMKEVLTESSPKQPYHYVCAGQQNHQCRSDTFECG